MFIKKRKSKKELLREIEYLKEEVIKQQTYKVDTTLKLDAIQKEVEYLKEEVIKQQIYKVDTIMKLDDIQKSIENN